MKWVFSILLLFCSLSSAGEWATLHEKLTRKKSVEYSKSRDFVDKESRTINHGITEIGLERTTCFGTCPAYTVLIKRDGTFRYRGERNVSRTGIYTGKVSQWQLMNSHRFIKESGYMNFEHTYSSLVTDNATVYTTVVMNGKRKIISNYANRGPANLWAIEELLDKLLLNAQWDTQKTSK